MEIEKIIPSLKEEQMPEFTEDQELDCGFSFISSRWGEIQRRQVSFEEESSIKQGKGKTNRKRNRPEQGKTQLESHPKYDVQIETPSKCEVNIETPPTEMPLFPPAVIPGKRKKQKQQQKIDS